MNVNCEWPVGGYLPAMVGYGELETATRLGADALGVRSGRGVVLYAHPRQPQRGEADLARTGIEADPKLERLSASKRRQGRRGSGGAGRSPSVRGTETGRARRDAPRQRSHEQRPRQSQVGHAGREYSAIESGQNPQECPENHLSPRPRVRHDERCWEALQEVPRRERKKATT